LEITEKTVLQGRFLLRFGDQDPPISRIRSLRLSST
jgi:hypothetical protein